MKHQAAVILNNLISAYPILEDCRDSVEKAFQMICLSYKNKGKLLLCGNGGSASDSEHIVGELMKGFKHKRLLARGERELFERAFPADGQYLAEHLQGALPAISLVSHTALSSAYINDVRADLVFAQQVYGYGQPGDILLGLSTSGNSANVVLAVKTAKAMGLGTIGMTGASGGKLKELCDTSICVPQTETYKIQELHLPVYHALCAMLEEEFFGESA